MKRSFGSGSTRQGIESGRKPGAVARTTARPVSSACAENTTSLGPGITGYGARFWNRSMMLESDERNVTTSVSARRCGVPDESVVVTPKRTLSVPRIARGTGSTGSLRWRRGVDTWTRTVSGANNGASPIRRVRPARRPRTWNVPPTLTYITLSGAVATLVSTTRRWTHGDTALSA